MAVHIGVIIGAVTLSFKELFIFTWVTLFHVVSCGNGAREIQYGDSQCKLK
jgi:hypothetical protein